MSRLPFAIVARRIRQDIPGTRYIDSWTLAPAARLDSRPRVTLASTVVVRESFAGKHFEALHLDWQRGGYISRDRRPLIVAVPHGDDLYISLEVFA